MRRLLLKFRGSTALIVGLSACLGVLGTLPWQASAIERSGLGQLLQQIAGTSSSHAENIAAVQSASGTPEQLLIQGLLEITQGKIQQAQTTIDQVLQNTPNFRLAQLVRGDLLMAKAQQFQSFGSSINKDSYIEELKQEARKRLEFHLAQIEKQSLSIPFWQLPSNVNHALLVDSDQSRLYLFRNEQGKLVYQADYYVTIGKNGSEKRSEGDKRTPLGVYQIDRKLNRKLDPFYGDAAYPISYPNEWDKRLGRSGSGIWLHGTPHDTYSRPPQASDGCIVMTNPDLRSLSAILENGNIPLVVVNRLGIDTSLKNARLREQLLQEIETWRADWQSQNTDQYLRHYASNFYGYNMDIARWSQEKRRIQAAKPQVQIALSKLSVIHSPNADQVMAVVTFEQDFRSPTLQNQMRKRQYWVHDGQHWKIVFEGAL